MSYASQLAPFAQKANTTLVVIGNTTINTTSVALTGSGSDVVIDNDSISIGNSTVNTSISAQTITLNGVNVNTAITTNAATAYNNAVAYAAANTYVNNTFAPKADPTFTGTVTANNVSITGNLTVSGTTTYINTNTLNIGDNIITLNADASGAPTEDAGVQVKRGSSANVELLWNETTDKWTFTNDGTTYYNVASNTDVSTAYSNATSYADTKAATAYSNATSYADTAAATAYSNATSYADTKAATAYSNATSYADTAAATAYSNATAFAANASNISSGTLDTARLPATANVSTAINVGTNVNITTSTINIGNSTVNTFANSTHIVSGVLKSSASAGDEGGEIQLALSQNTTLTGGVTIDIYQNRLRIFEAGGSNRGAYIDLTSATNGVGSNLLSPSGGGATLVANTTDTQTFYIPMSNATSGSWSNAVIDTNLSFVPSTNTLSIAGVLANNSGVYPTSNSVATALGSTTNRWVINANTGNFSGAITTLNGVYPSTNTSGQALGSTTQRWVITANTITASGNATVTGTVTANTVAEVKAAPSISAGTLTLNLASATAFETTLNANISTLTLQNTQSTGYVSSFVLVLVADGTARSVTWPASFKWPSGTAPTLTSTLNKKDVFAFFTYDGGTTWHAFICGQNL